MAYTEEQVIETIPVVRPVLEQIAHKWSILVLAFLCEEPKRFNALKRRLDGITQKALTDTLRRLQRNGLVDRRVATASPIAVVYSITPLGRTLQEPFVALYEWAICHQADLLEAHQKFDSASEED
jgi:DNA-binding HxlR family transcriptional regulator